MCVGHVTFPGATKKNKESEINKSIKRYLNTRSLRTHDNLAELSSKLQAVPTIPWRTVLPDYQVPADPAVLHHARRREQSHYSATPGHPSSSTSYAATATATVVDWRHLWLHGKLELGMAACWLYIAYWNLAFDVWFGKWR